MAKQVQLKAQSRTETGKGHVKRMRAQGFIPGIVYGAKAQPLNIAVKAKDLEDVLHHASSENVLVDLQVEGTEKTGNRLTLIQEVQHHPVQDQILHVDFHEVSATEKLRTDVPVRAIGEPEGVKTGGGILEFVMRELRVECLPQDLPEVIEVNVEHMLIGQTIHVEDIKAPAGVTLLDDKGQTVFLVAAPITEEELAAATAPAEAVEPEVIGAKPEEGEEGAVAEGEAKPAAGKAEAGKPAAAGKGEAKPAEGKAAAATGKAPAAKAPAAGAAGKAPAAGAAKPEAKPGKK